ncbi:MAG: phosphomannomutase/phosphoglucomutase [Phycisphaerales bacterium]|jgi:phosphomannomutase|nr:phosphomannomutase/phosphoglucomutase [Phycisphaerales bacterium]
MAGIDDVFKAYDIRGIYGDGIDEDLAWKIGHASAQFFRSLLSGYDRGQFTANRMVIGRDMRPHGKFLSDALVEGVTATGTTCIDLGMVDTPMIYFAVNHLGALGGLQITASHNSMEYNGFKLCGQKAKPVGENTGLREIKHIISTLGRMPTSASIAMHQEMDLWDEYRKHVHGFLKMSRPLKVVIDALNGMGGVMVSKLFDGTMMEIIPINFEIGMESVNSPNPMLESNLRRVKEAVVQEGADFGVCLDGDADRCVFIDETGADIRCDLMTAMMSPYLLAGNPGASVIYDLRSSRVVSEEIRTAGGLPRRERVGHSFMKKALADSGGVFGGELSGHFYFRDNYNCDSAAIMLASVASVLSDQSATFSEIIAPLNRYSHSGEINFEVTDKKAAMKEIADALPGAEVDSLDGVTCQFPDWWCNVRPSNTEPLLRLTLEAANVDMMNEKVDFITQMLGPPVDH